MCTPIDLLSKLGSVRNQVSPGWCFAYSTAELVSFKIEQKVSAVELAIDFYIRMPEMLRGDLLSKVAGGINMGAMSYATKGFCAEEDMLSENCKVSPNCLANNKTLETLDIIRLIENIHQEMPEDLTSCQVNIISSLFVNLIKRRDSVCAFGSKAQLIGKNQYFKRY